MAAESDQPLKVSPSAEGKARLLAFNTDVELGEAGQAPVEQRALQPSGAAGTKGSKAPQAKQPLSRGASLASASTSALPAAPANAAKVLETLEELRGMKSCMEDILGQFATKLSRHEEQLKVALSLADLPSTLAVAPPPPPPPYRVSEGSSTAATSSFETGTIITAQEIAVAGVVSGLRPLDSEESSTSSVGKTSTVSNEEIDRAKKRSRRVAQLKKDVVALEVCEGWRSKLTDDFGGRCSRTDSAAALRALAEKPKSIDVIGCVLIIANAIFMLLEVEADMKAAMAGEAKPSWTVTGNVTFATLFVFELLIRFSMEKGDFFFGHNWAWNLFDAICVLTQLLDLALQSVSVGFLRVLRSVRVIRAARIVKTAPWMRELRVMISVLAKSLSSVVWAFAIVLGLASMFTLFICQVVAGAVRAVGASGMDPDLLRYYGSLGSCLQTLFMTVMGGEAWHSSAAPLWGLGVGYYLLYAVFQGFLVLGMLNIVTAVFVDSTIRISDSDHSNVNHVEFNQEDSEFNQLRNLLEKVAGAEDGSITRGEFESVIADAKGKQILHSMGICSHEATAAFHLLDAENQGLSNIMELTCTLKRLKGASKSLDIATMLYDNKRVTRYIASVQENIELRFDRLKEVVENTARKQALDEIRAIEAAKARQNSTNPLDRHGKPKTMTDFIRDALDKKFTENA